MASASLGQLTLDLVARIGGFVDGLTAAERAAQKSSKAIQKNLEGISTASVALGTAIGTNITQGIELAINAFPRLLESVAKFQDLAEEFGGGAADLASLAVAAGTAGVSIESVTAASIKLTKGLTGVDDEGKAVGAALKAIGLEIDAFKKLDPVAQYESISKALGGYADGAGKTAVALALFGKAGAEQLRVLKALDEQGGRSQILTQEQIAQADDYLDRQAKLRTELGLYAGAVATQFIEPTNALMKVVKDATAELLGMGKGIDGIGANNGVRLFAEAAGRDLAGLIDMVNQTKKEFAVLADIAKIGSDVLPTFLFKGPQAAGEQLKQLGKNFRDTHGLDEFGRGTGKNAAKSAVDAFNEYLASSKRSAFALTDPRRLDLGADGRPVDNRSKVAFDGAAKPSAKGRTDHSAEQEAKAQLAADLDQYKLQLQAFADANGNNEKILSAMRSAGLVEDKAFYDEKLKLLNDFSAKQIDEQLKAIDRLNLEQDTQNFIGKDQIENNRKIAAAEAALAKIRADAITQVKVLGIESKSSADKTVSAMLAANQAAKSFLDTLKAGYDLEISGIGRGDKFKQQASELQSLNEKFEQQRQDLRNRRAIAENADTFGPEAKRRYEDELEIIRTTNAEAVKLFQDRYAKITAAQGDWLTGATSALENYADEARNVSKGIGEVFGNAFKGLEDGLTNLATGKKFDIKSLFDNLNADVMRQLIKTNITGPLSEALNGQLKSGTGAGGLIGKYFTDLFPNKGKTSTAGTSLTGDSETDKLTGLTGSSSASSFADATKSLLGSSSSAASLTALTTASGATAAVFASLTAAATGAAAALASVAASSVGSAASKAFGSGFPSWGTGTGTATDSWDFSGFASGGYTGAGGIFQPAGIVHRGEYVMDAAATKRLGVSNLEALRNGGSMGGGGQTNHISVNVLPGATRQTGYQAARDMARELARQSSR